MATALLLVIYLTFISLGLPDSMLGAAWPVAHLALDVPISYGGFTSIFATAGTVISSLVSVRLIRRFGTGRVTALCVVLTAFSLLGISFANSYVFVCLLFIPLGLGGGSIDAALNNYVALHYRAIHMNFLHAFWGVGATAGPLIMAAFLAQNGNWHGGYRAVGGIQLALAAVALLALPLWSRVARRGTEDEELSSQTEIAGNREAVRNPGVRVAMLVFLFYCAAEVSAGLWAATFFVRVKGLSAERAAQFGSLFYFGVMAGRILAGFASARLQETKLIRIGLVLSVLGVLALLLPGAYAAAGLLLFGIGCAPVFPNMLQLTPKRFGKRLSQAAIGVQMAVSYIGCTVMPPLFGLLAGWLGFTLYPPFLLACILALVYLTERLNKRYSATSLAE